jgi:hypothetical protein
MRSNLVSKADHSAQCSIIVVDIAFVLTIDEPGCFEIRSLHPKSHLSKIVN